MSDVIFIAVVIAFFVLCALYVQLCDRMIGPDDFSAVPTADTTTDEPASAELAVSTVGNQNGVTP